MTIETLKELYFRELDIKAQLDARMTVYVAVMTAAAGVIAFLFKNAWPAQQYLQYGTLALALTSSILLSFAIVWAFRANLGYVYQRLPSSEDLLGYFRKLSDYYVRVPQAIGNAPDEYEHYLMDRLAEAATRNTTNNLGRSAYYYRSTLFIMWTFVSSALAGISLVAQQVAVVVLGKGP